MSNLRRRPFVFAVIVAAAAIAGCASWPGSRITARPPVPNSPLSTSDGVAVAGGSLAFRDPNTGDFGEAPEAAVRTLLANRGLSTAQRSQTRLVETRGTTAAGGVRVALDERFSTAIVAVRDAQGRVSVACGELPAASSRDGGKE